LEIITEPEQTKVENSNWWI